MVEIAPRSLLFECVWSGVLLFGAMCEVDMYDAAGCSARRPHGLGPVRRYRASNEYTVGTPFMASARSSSQYCVYIRGIWRLIAAATGRIRFDASLSVLEQPPVGTPFMASAPSSSRCRVYFRGYMAAWRPPLRVCRLLIPNSEFRIISACRPLILNS